MAAMPPVRTLDTTELAGALALSVTRLHRHLRRHSAGGLSPTQMSALSTVARQGPLTLGELATGEGVAPPTITKVIGKLADQGYVARTVDDVDRRVHRVAVTAPGRQYLETVRSRRKAWLAERLARLSVADREILAAAVEVIDRLDSLDDPLSLDDPPSSDHT